MHYAIPRIPAYYQTHLFAAMITVLFLGSGIRVFGYSLLDELLIPALLAAWVLLNKNLRVACLKKTETYVFLLVSIFCLLKTINIIISAFYFENLLLLKLAVPFATIPFFLYFTVSYIRSKDANGLKNLVKIFSVANITYCLLYIAQGTLSEILLGNRFLTQDTYWQGSALAVMPLGVMLPIINYALFKALIPMRTAAVNLALIILVGFFFDSRITYLLIVFYLTVGAFFSKTNMKFSAFGMILFVLIFSFFEKPSVIAFSGFTKNLAVGANVYNPRKEDLNRKLHLQAAFEHSDGEWNLKTIFGAGAYSHRMTLANAIKKKYKKAGLQNNHLLPNSRDDTAEEIKIIRSTALVASIVDDGLIVSALLFLCILSNVLIINRFNLRLLLTSGGIIGTSFCWMYATLATENYIFFYLCMPFGLITLLMKVDEVNREPSTCDKKPILGI